MKIYDYKGKKNICGERVRQARVLQHLTQSELAAKLQIEEVILERDSISRIEAGTRFVADFELLVLAKVLRVEPAWLLDAEVEK
ncbi:MAG: helix-turn-helix transcriptional regulator [Clostridia bacterium]|nr:helix-turn-helix transcriptional regulator [Clostridia bacterium]